MKGAERKDAESAQWTADRAAPSLPSLQCLPEAPLPASLRVASWNTWARSAIWNAARSKHRIVKRQLKNMPRKLQPVVDNLLQAADLVRLELPPAPTPPAVFGVRRIVGEAAEERVQIMVSAAAREDESASRCFFFAGPPYEECCCKRYPQGKAERTGGTIEALAVCDGTPTPINAHCSWTSALKVGMFTLILTVLN